MKKLAKTAKRIIAGEPKPVTADIEYIAPPYLIPTSEYSGPIDSEFLYADGLSNGDFKDSSVRSSVLALSEAKRNRLVEGSKSQTRDLLLNMAEKQAFFSTVRLPTYPKPLAYICDGPFSELGAKERREHQQIKTEMAEIEHPVTEPGTSTIIEFREFCEEYRIRTQVNPQMAPRPPTNSGLRESVMLSGSGARKIAESCQYMAIKHGGYKTFATGTFSPEARQRLSTYDIETRKPITTIQREVTRTMDAMKKMYQRGWQYESNGKTVLVPAAPLIKARNRAGKVIRKKNGAAKMVPDDFRYCWVVEIPKNEQGEDNPHIHLLMDWGVDFIDFQPWKTRIEGFWSNGTFKLEKIKDPEAAGAYMAKAAGYITKAQGQEDQGLVVGNRYAISSKSRAPAWVTISVSALGIMGRLIRETYDHIQHKYSKEFYKRKVLNEKRDDVIKRAKAMQKSHPDKLYPIKAKTLREKIGAKLQKVRAVINAIPIRASKYQLVIKDKYTFYKFLQKAEAVGWGADAPPSTQWIYRQKRLRQAWHESELCEYMDRAKGFIDDSLSSFADYEYWTQLSPPTELAA